MKYRRKKIPDKKNFFVFLILSFCFHGIVFSQNSENESKKSEKPLKLYVNVADSDGRYYNGLIATDAHLFVDGREQKILSVERKEEPISVGIIIDISGSMEKKLAESMRGLAEFLSNSNTKNEYFFVTFNDEIKELADFSQNRQKIFETIKNVSTIKTKRSTRLFDAVDFGYNKLSKAKFEKRVLLLICDGQDNISEKKFKEIRQIAEKNNALVYSVGIADMRDFSSLDAMQMQAYIDDLSAITGGKAFYPATNAEIEEVFQRIALELRSQYIFSFEVENEIYEKAKKKGRAEVKLKVEPLNYKPNYGKQKTIKLDARTREKLFLDN